VPAPGGRCAVRGSNVHRIAADADSALEVQRQRGVRAPEWIALRALRLRDRRVQDDLRGRH
jgi:hypothetical protein